jgi:hypothetical protein
MASGDAAPEVSMMIIQPPQQGHGCGSVFGSRR